MSSSQTDTSFLGPTVEELGDGEASFADEQGQLFHLDDEFHFTLAVTKKGAKEMAQTCFGVT